MVHMRGVVVEHEHHGPLYEVLHGGLVTAEARLKGVAQQRPHNKLLQTDTDTTMPRSHNNGEGRGGVLCCVHRRRVTGEKTTPEETEEEERERERDRERERERERKSE